MGIGLSLVIAVLFASNLLLGSVSIPAENIVRILLGDTSEKASWRYIILESRLPQAITAMFCGASLAVSGLMLQTVFRLRGGTRDAFPWRRALCRLSPVQWLCGSPDGGFHWSDGSDGGYLFLFHIGT